MERGFEVLGDVGRVWRRSFGVLTPVRREENVVVFGTSGALTVPLGNGQHWDTGLPQYAISNGTE